MTHDTFKVGGGEPFLKMLAPLLLRFGSEGVLKIWRKRVTEQITELLTKLFVEQPQLHRVC